MNQLFLEKKSIFVCFFKVASNGTVLRSEIVGAIKIRSYLSGMPELRLGLNDRVQFENTGRGKISIYLLFSEIPIPPFFFLAAATGGRGKTIEMEDIVFHQCVQLSRFETDHTISFTPPDGEFELMTYRLNTTVQKLDNFGYLSTRFFFFFF